MRHSNTFRSQNQFHFPKRLFIKRLTMLINHGHDKTVIIISNGFINFMFESFYLQIDVMLGTYIFRVLSRIFCLGGGGKSILKKVFEPRGGEEKFFRPSRGVRGHAHPENFENIEFKIG